MTDSVEKAAKAGKIKITSINDYTAEDVEIEIKLARGVYAKDTIKALYAFTDCEVSITPNLTLINGTTPETTSVSAVLKHNTYKLKDDLQRGLKIDLGRLEEKLHSRLLEQIFIEERLYKNIEEETSYNAVINSVAEGLTNFTDELLRPVTKEDIEKLLEIKIKRISRYDINRQQKEIRAIRKEIAGIKRYLKDMVGYTISFLDTILEKYGADYPRKTEIKSFSEVSIRKVALSNLVVGYNRESGFMGHLIKVENEKEDQSVACSEYDRLILIFSTGLYKIIPVTDKLFVGHELEWFGLVKRDTIFNIIYRDGVGNVAYVKRFKSPKFILDKDYKLFTEHKRSKILLMSFGEGKFARVNLMPSSRARTNSIDIIFDEYLIKGASAKGKRISNRVVRRVVSSTGPRILPVKQNLPLPGLIQKDISSQATTISETEAQKGQSTKDTSAEKKEEQ